MNYILIIAVVFIVLAVLNFKNVNTVKKPDYIYEKTEKNKESAQKKFQQYNPQYPEVKVLYSPDWRHNWSFTTHGIYYRFTNNEGRVTGQGIVPYESITKFFLEKIPQNNNFYDMHVYYETEKGQSHLDVGVVTEYRTLTMDKLQVYIRQATTGGEA